MNESDNSSASFAPSTYLKYLPAIYSEDDFWGRFLCLFEDILRPIEERIEQTEYFFDPAYTPDDFHQWLASWMNVELNAGRINGNRNDVLTDLIRLHQWRGTKRGVFEHIRLMTGFESTLSRSPAGMILGDDAILGENTTLSSRSGHSHFIVTVFADNPGTLDRDLLSGIIDVHCPAHATYSLQISAGEDPGEAIHE